jgi:hypothetical protein
MNFLRPASSPSHGNSSGRLCNVYENGMDFASQKPLDRLDRDRSSPEVTWSL